MDGGPMRSRRRAAGALAAGALAIAVLAAVGSVLLGAPWLWAVAALGAVLAVAALAAPGRAPALGDPAGPHEPPAAPRAPGPAVRDVDDLPGFFTHPPGSPPGAVTTPPAASPPVAEEPPADAGAPDPGAGSRGRRTRGLVAGGAVVVVVGVVVTAVVATGRGDDDTPTADGPASGSTTAARTSATAAPLTADVAGGLADTDLPPGDEGFSATLSFAGVVLEPRAVGVTVTYPELRVSDDGSSTVVHLDLPVWNCLSADPPADPTAAQCSRSLAEFADLGTPALDVVRTGSRVDLEGAVATYTRPNGSDPVYTGRSYDLAVQLVPAGAGATGTLSLGGTPVGTTGPGSFSG